MLNTVVHLKKKYFQSLSSISTRYRYTCVTPLTTISNDKTYKIPQSNNNEGSKLRGFGGVKSCCTPKPSNLYHRRHCVSPASPTPTKKVFSGKHQGDDVANVLPRKSRTQHYTTIYNNNNKPSLKLLKLKLDILQRDTLYINTLGMTALNLIQRINPGQTR